MRTKQVSAYLGISLLLLASCERHENHEIDGDEAGGHAAEAPDPHAGHDHAAHGDDPADEEAGIELDPHELEELGIEIRTAAGGSLAEELGLTGEVHLNPDLLAHVTPRTPGVVREVHKSVGDRVTAGELIAVLDSRELATAKAELLAAGERLVLADATYDREKQLRTRGISSEQDFLDARQKKAEAEIDVHVAEQRLQALGLDKEALESLARDSGGQELTRYEMHAPIDGEIIEKHITRGERLSEEDSAFEVADLSRVWVLLTVYQKDLAAIEPGQQVVLSMGAGGPSLIDHIDYVSPVLNEETRAATARVEVSNESGIWRPGLFITARVLLQSTPIAVVVPRSAIQMLGEHEVVFVESDHGFQARDVTTGRTDAEQVEILSGLEVGERYVATGAFVLKAELGKGSLGDGHAH
jgi:cobalt-zinc-cadmium efflux system membrane fusion protein